MFTKAFRSVSVSRKVAMLALFIAVSVVANSVLGVDIGASNKIAFTYLVCFFAGCMMGPVPAFIVGVVGDAIGFLIQPVGVFWFFGVTLGLFGFLTGLIMNGIRTKTVKGLYAKAALAFAQSGKGRSSLITLLDRAADGIAGKTGTIVRG